jgi:hypothetical protein
MAKPQAIQQHQQATQMPARTSAKVSAAAQLVEDLEDDLMRERQLRQDAENRAKVAEMRCEDLEADLRQFKAETSTELRTVKAECDLNLKLWTETRAKLEASASIILDAMDHKTAVETRSRQEALHAVDKALGDVEPQPLPAFLAAGPRIDGSNGSSQS